MSDEYDDCFGDDLDYNDPNLFSAFHALESQSITATATAAAVNQSKLISNNILGSLATKTGAGVGVNHQKKSIQHNNNIKVIPLPQSRNPSTRTLGRIVAPPATILRPAQPPGSKRQRVDQSNNPFVHTSIVPPPIQPAVNVQSTRKSSEVILDEDMPEIRMDADHGYVATRSEPAPPHISPPQTLVAVPLATKDASTRSNGIVHQISASAEEDRRELARLRAENAAVSLFVPLPPAPALTRTFFLFQYRAKILAVTDEAARTAEALSTKSGEMVLVRARIEKVGCVFQFLSSPDALLMCLEFNRVQWLLLSSRMRLEISLLQWKRQCSRRNKSIGKK